MQVTREVHTELELRTGNLTLKGDVNMEGFLTGGDMVGAF